MDNLVQRLERPDKFRQAGSPVVQVDTQLDSLGGSVNEDYKIAVSFRRSHCFDP